MTLCLVAARREVLEPDPLRNLAAFELGCPLALLIDCLVAARREVIGVALHLRLLRVLARALLAFVGLRLDTTNQLTDNRSLRQKPGAIKLKSHCAPMQLMSEASRNESSPCASNYAARASTREATTPMLCMKVSSSRSSCVDTDARTPEMCSSTCVPVLSVRVCAEAEMREATTTSEDGAEPK